MSGSDESFELCLEGIPCSAPPCAPCFEKCCGKCCCYSFAKVGFPSLSQQHYRAPIFLILSFLSFIQIIFAIVSACGLSSSGNTIQAVPWIKFELASTISNVNFDREYFFGLTNVHITSHDHDGKEETLSWDKWCSSLEEISEESVSLCEKCADSSETFYTTVIITVLSKFGQFTTDLTRSNGHYDVPCQKVFGALVPILGFITSVIALAEYNRTCYESLPHDIIGFKSEANHGIGYDFQFFVTIVGVIDIIFNVLIPLPQKGDPNYNYYNNLEGDSNVKGSADLSSVPHWEGGKQLL